MKYQHKNIHLLLVVAGIIFFRISVIAQAPPAEYIISGTVADSATKRPLGFLTVQLKEESDTIAKTSLTKADGSFLFAGLKPVKYRLQIIAVGFHSKTLAIDHSGSTRTDVGTIFIRNKVNTLGEVVVTAQKALVKQETDRITYDLQADPESKVNSVLEMMRKVPFLSLDGDENILLNGSSNYKVLINGKPSGMMDRNPRDILRSMPASTIKSIEVITNPSSKYDAEGLAGIINIITSKKIDNGYNGSINLNHRFLIGGPGAGALFAFKQGKLGMSAIGGTNIYNTPVSKTLNNRKTTGANATNLDQNSTAESASRSAYFGAEISYEPDSLNLFSTLINFNGSRTDGSNYQGSLLNGISGVLQQYDLTNNNTNNGNGIDAALNYQLGFRSGKDRLLTFSYRYLGYVNDLFNAMDVSNPVNFASPDYNQTNTGSSSEQTFQLDYIHRVKKLNIEGGIKGILRTNKSDFQYRSFDSADSKFEVDPTRTNQFHNNQNVFAAYNTYQYDLRNWGIKVGFRVEQTLVKADFVSVTTQVKQNYLSVIPSVNINRKLNDRSSLNFAFTNRIQRPGISQLNPFADLSNPDFESTGNPKLKPAYTNVFQISYNKSKKATVNIALGYMHFRDLIGPVSAYDPATRITRTSFENVGRAMVLKTNFYLSYPVNKKVNLRLNSDIRYVSSDVMVNNTLIKNSGLMGYFNVSGGYRFEKGWRLNADITFNTAGISSVQGKSNGFTGSSFGVQKDLIKDKLTFSTSVNNPFVTYRRIRKTVAGPDFNQVIHSEVYYRSVAISLNYRFGKLKEAVKKSKRGINNDDVSN